MKEYRLTKIDIDEGKASAVRAGKSVSGEMMIFIHTDPDNVKKEATLEDVKAGKQVMVFRSFFDFVRTSPVEEIVEKTDRSITFKTGTSTYLLEEMIE